MAQGLYLASFKTSIDAARNNLNFLEIAWRRVGDEASRAWTRMSDAARNAVGANTGEERLAEARQKLAAMQKPGYAWGFNLSMTERRKAIDDQKYQVEYLERVLQAQKDGAKAEATRQEVQRNGLVAQAAVGAVQDKGLTRQQQLNKALADYRENLDKIRAANPNSALLDPAKIKAGEDALRKQFKEDKPKAYTEDPGSRMLANLKEQEAALRVRLSSEVGLNTALQEQAKFEAQIADIKGKTQLTDEQKALLRAHGLRAGFLAGGQGVSGGA